MNCNCKMIYDEVTIEMLYRMPSGARACDRMLELYHIKYGKRAVPLATFWEEWDSEDADADRIWFTLNYLPKDKRDALVLDFLAQVMKTLGIVKYTIPFMNSRNWPDAAMFAHNIYLSKLPKRLRDTIPTPVFTDAASLHRYSPPLITQDKYCYAPIAFRDAALSFLETDECAAAHYAYRAAVAAANTAYPRCADAIEEQILFCERMLSR